VRVRIWDWHRSASKKLEAVGYKHGECYTLTTEQICGLADHFSVMIRKVSLDTECDYLVSVSIHCDFGQH